MTTLSSVLGTVYAYGGLSFAYKEGSYIRTLFVELFKIFLLTSGGVILLDNVAFHHSPCVRAFADAVGVELLFIPSYAPWLIPVQECFLS